MRPVTLQLAGLQSYREMQEIDFTQLTDAGVFGIFGPTGSGKSSVLDAITLALYGKVERAPNGTQGIINQAENSLGVSLTFELTRPSGPDRYRIDRQFKRTGDVGVAQTISRLIHYTAEGTIVLADKAKEVDQQVQELLGLSMADFTRAVVLPQGKFAEFLTLTGKERRMMLQRLFRLEAYGERLNAKVSARLKDTEVELKELTAEQQGLGDASAEALELASAQLADAEQKASAELTVLQQAEREHEEWKQLIFWQREQAEVERQLEAMTALEPDIKDREEKLALADRAERLAPYLERLEAARRLAEETEARSASASTSYTEAECVERAAASEREAAVEALNAQEEPLLFRISQLEQALELESEHQRLRQSAAELERQTRQAELELEGVRTRISKELETKEKALRKQAELKESLANCAVSAQESQTLQMAVQEREAVGTIRVQLAELQTESDKGAREAAQLEQALRAARRGLEAQGADLLRGLVEAGPPEKSLAEAERELEELAKQAAEQLEGAKREREGAALHALAEQLAEKLRSGEPCPVCGSPDHPAPAVSGDGAGSTIAAASDEASWEQLLAEARELLLTLRQLMFRWRTSGKQAEQLLQGDVRESWQEAAAGLNAGTSERLGARESFGAWPWASVAFDENNEDQPGRTAELSAAYRGKLSAMCSWIIEGEQRTVKLEALTAHASAGLRTAERRVHELATQLEAQQRLLDGQRVKAEDVADQLKQREMVWQQRYPQLVGRDVHRELEAVRAKELQAEELRSRLAKSDMFMDELARRLELLAREEVDVDREALQFRTKQQGEMQLAAAVERQLQARLGNERAEPLLAGARNALAGLREAAAAAQRAHELARAALQRSAEQRSAALEACGAAARQLAQANAAWLTAFGSAAEAFRTEEAVKAAFLRAELRERWADEVSMHRAREIELRAQRQQLELRRGGRVAADADWAAAQERLRAAKQRREAALEARAKAARDAEDLEVKHARWNELEQRRVERAAQYARLGKLQTVLRGNAFVEFLAEEQLMQVCRAASERLGYLTRRRYALEVDSSGGFVIRDDANGGVRRPVTTLSGGETFLTSLSLALALSAQIQLKGEVPLEFFFLDEGFGTLDPELLEAVIHALEKLHTDRLAVGVISHVPELQARLPRRLVVHPAEPSGRGSRVSLERL